jgi:hypothetical protein
VVLNGIEQALQFEISPSLPVILERNSLGKYPERQKWDADGDTVRICSWAAFSQDLGVTVGAGGMSSTE